jgi:hypothetical protein
MDGFSSPTELFVVPRSDAGSSSATAVNLTGDSDSSLERLLKQNFIDTSDGEISS